MNINTKFITGIFTFLPLWVNGQVFKDDMMELRKKFSGNYSINIQTQIISNNPQYPSVTYQGFLKVKGTEMNYKQGEEEVLYTKNYLLLISHQEKSMIIDTANKDYNAAPLYFLEIDTLQQAYKSIVYSTVNNKKIYTITPLAGEVSRFIITLTADGNLEKMEISLSASEGGGSAQIFYSSFIQNPTFTSEEFSPFRFIQRNGNTFNPTEKYKSYTIESNL